MRERKKEERRKNEVEMKDRELGKGRRRVRRGSGIV